MPRHCLILIAMGLCACAASSGTKENPTSMDDAPPNMRLVQLFNDDQTARKTKNVDWSVVGAQDTARRDEVMNMFRAGQLRSTIDFCNAALIFQHGLTADDARMAFSFAWLCHSLIPVREYNLPALAWDRIMMYENQPQWYGTQYNTINGKTQLYRVNESAVTDEERYRMGCPPLSEAKANAKNFDQ